MLIGTVDDGGQILNLRDGPKWKGMNVSYGSACMPDIGPA